MAGAPSGEHGTTPFSLHTPCHRQITPDAPLGNTWRPTCDGWFTREAPDSRRTRSHATDDEIVQRYLNADGSLRQMPAKRGPRMLVLAHIAGRIPVGIELKEPAVNDALRPASTDVAMLRRALVDEGLVERWPPGIYRRPGEPSSTPKLAG